MTSGIQSKGIDLDNIFAAYVSGTHPPATGIKVNGVGIANRYQPLPGTSAPATGIKTNGADLNTLFSTTSSQTLPINGKSYLGQTKVSSGTGSAFITFAVLLNAGNYIYQITASSLSGTAVLASGPVPTGAVNVKFTWGTPFVPSGYVAAGGSTTNNAAASTPITSQPGATYTTNSFTSTSGSHATSYPFAIDFYNSSGANISTTNITLTGEVDGSV